MSAVSVISELKGGAPLLTLMKMIKGYFDSRSSADELYMDLIPVLQDLLREGRGYDDPSVQHIVHILGELQPYGHRRDNFRKKYLQDEYGLRSLPADPRDIMAGYWF
ncbi:hypothetical protein [Vibrio salinus]|uniref:hypothetical protein n=1 Tax=Vibrio salinus TaxID=2899784 RepID=UPI001E501BB2|nr:hypothetical protein [Vibrio salinus]MCE0494429.1 hypothetical protein [Vibrio salinus]